MKQKYNIELTEVRFARVQKAIWTAFFDACHKSNKAEKDGDNFAAEYHKKEAAEFLDLWNTLCDTAPQDCE